MANPYPTSVVPYKNPVYMTPGVRAASNAVSTINRIPQPKTQPRTAPKSPSRPAPDPAAAARAAAAAAERERVNNIIKQVQVGQAGIQQGGQTQIRDITNSYSQNNRNTVQNIKSGQTAINRTRENTALNLRRGMAGIVNSIRQGLRSGAVQLANMNASDSGASEALARAYSRLGNTQVGDIRNQAFLENRDTDLQQQQLDQTRSNALADFKTYRDTEVDRISSSLLNQLQVLDANAQAQGVNGKVNFGIRDTLINEAIAKLNQIDQQTSAALSGVRASTPQEIAAAAIQLDAAGAAGGNPFSYQVPTSGSVSPAYSSVGGLPIYYRRDEQLGV